MAALPGAQIRPIPSLDLSSPEVHIVPDRIRAADLDLDADRLGRAVDILLDGRKVSECEHQGRKIDLMLRGPLDAGLRTRDIENLLLAGAGAEETAGLDLTVAVLPQGYGFRVFSNALASSVFG